MMRAHISNQDYERISAYLDGQLAPGEQRKLEERMRAHPELKVAFEELSQTRAMIRMVPRRRAPRNFTLTPAMVGDVQRGRRWGAFPNLFPALSFASALATLVLVMTLVFQMSPGLQPASTAQNDAPAVAMEAPAGEPEAGQEAMRAQEVPAEPQEDAAMPASEPQAPLMEGAPAEKAAGSELAAQPPIITWYDPNAPPMDPSAYTYGGAGGYATAPRYPFGMGGGGGDGPVMDYGGSAGSLPGGGLILPLEAAESVASDTSAAAELPAAEEAPSASGAQPAAGLDGGGPILGLPSAEDAGQVEMESAFGRPLGAERIVTGSSPEEARPETADLIPAPEPEPARTSLVTLQALLALLAIITGVAAFFVHRKRS